MSDEEEFYEQIEIPFLVPHDEPYGLVEVVALGEDDAVKLTARRWHDEGCPIFITALEARQVASALLTAADKLDCRYE